MNEKPIDCSKHIASNIEIERRQMNQEDATVILRCFDASVRSRGGTAPSVSFGKLIFTPKGKGQCQLELRITPESDFCKLGIFDRSAISSWVGYTDEEQELLGMVRMIP